MIRIEINEVFEHIDEDGTVRRFSIKALRASIERKDPGWDLVEGPLTEADVAHMALNHGVILANVARLPAEQLEQPCIGCRFADESVLLVDGNHRFVARYAAGLKTVQVWVCDEAVWSRCLIDLDDCGVMFDSLVAKGPRP